MSENEGTAADVIVVGAGPTGLLLAGDLAEAGLAVTLVERREHKISNLSRALVVHARTLEQLEARGLAGELVAKGHPIDRLRLFGNAELDPGRLPSKYAYVLFLPQYEVEKVLERRAREAGVAFSYETEVTGVEQDSRGVRLLTADPDVTFRAEYVVGTDGVHSAVREALGLEFPGKSILSSLILADVKLGTKPDRAFTITAGDSGFVLLTEMGDDWYRVTGWNRAHQHPDDYPLDLDEVREVLRANLGTDYGLTESRWMSRFHSDERQAPSYRVGRVFLAGDAAHVHSPAGAMGMNTGLQDAANLSWKLVAVLRHGAPEAVLDTYQAERHAVGKVVLRISGMMVRAATVHGPVARFVRSVGAQVVNRVRPVSDRMARMISGVGISYKAERGAPKQVGTRAPDHRLAEGSLHGLLDGTSFLLISPDGADVPDHVSQAHWTDGRSTSVLVRPDGYVAWVGDASGAREAIARWAGGRAA